MRARESATALKALSAAYLACGSAFALAIGYNSNTQLGEGARQAVRLATPTVQQWAAATKRNVIDPAAEWTVAKDKEFFAWVDKQRSYPLPHPVAVAKKTPPPAERKLTVAKIGAITPPPVLRPSVIPQGPVAAAPSPELAENEQPTPVLVPVPDPHAPSAAELARVLSHMKVSLTTELYNNFDLFLYVSKADKGPWAQRMYVFQKKPDDSLRMLYEWPVSTGRELFEVAADGKKVESSTPQGYYQLDPQRMYKHYHSHEWDQPMPYAMFFNWENGGRETGLAIHGASGANLELLGQRSSAGCVHLDPQNARILFNMIRKDYKGLAPRFAYDRRTATMSNDGLLMHDKQGNLEYAEGYKVLVFIENDGGANVVAALF